MEWIKQFNEWVKVCHRELENISHAFEKTSSLIHELVEKKKYTKQEPFYKLPKNYHYKKKVIK